MDGAASDRVVGVLRMVDSDLARETGIAMANGRHLGHTGRVGAYPEALAKQGDPRRALRSATVRLQAIG